MRQPVVLTKAQVDAEVSRLCQTLRAARKVWAARTARAPEPEFTTRALAQKALINQGTLYRLEHGRTQPTLFVFMRVASQLGQVLDLDDGSRRPALSLDEWAGLPGYRVQDRVHQYEWGTQLRQANHLLHRHRAALGAVLWYARQHEVTPCLDAADACRLLGMNHHTLGDVEYGPAWPALSSLVRVAGLSGYTVVLNDDDGDLRAPPWMSPGPITAARPQPSPHS